MDPARHGVPFREVAGYSDPTAKIGIRTVHEPPQLPPDPHLVQFKEEAIAYVCIILS